MTTPTEKFRGPRLGRLSLSKRLNLEATIAREPLGHLPASQLASQPPPTAGACPAPPPAAAADPRLPPQATQSDPEDDADGFQGNFNVLDNLLDEDGPRATAAECRPSAVAVLEPTTTARHPLNGGPQHLDAAKLPVSDLSRPNGNPFAKASSARTVSLRKATPPGATAAIVDSSAMLQSLLATSEVPSRQKKQENVPAQPYVLPTAALQQQYSANVAQGAGGDSSDDEFAIPARRGLGPASTTIPPAAQQRGGILPAVSNAKNHSQTIGVMSKVAIKGRARGFQPPRTAPRPPPPAQQAVAPPAEIIDLSEMNSQQGEVRAASVRPRQGPGDTPMLPEPAGSREQPWHRDPPPVGASMPPPAAPAGHTPAASNPYGSHSSHQARTLPDPVQPFGPIAIFDAFPSTAPGGAGIGTAREAETAAQGGPSREESAYRDAPEVYDVEDDGFAGDVRGAEVQQPLSCGDAPGQSGSVFSAGREGEAWWYRLPDLVPVSVLVSGVNPRDNTPVYINYAMQFSGKRGGGATAASKAASRGRAAAGEGGGTKAKRATKKAAAAGAGEARTGHWTTVNGVRTYNTADGRQLTGTRAFTAYSKDTGGSAAPKRRKKKVKRKTSAKRARK